MKIEKLEKATSIFKEIEEVIKIRDRAKKVKEYFAKIEEEVYTPLESRFQIGDSQALSFYLHPEIINIQGFIEGYISECDKFIAIKENEFENL